MSESRALVPIAFAFAVVALLGIAGPYGRTPSIDLLQVLDVAPRDVEVGDRMAITGNGFPAGKPARITFRGTLYRPGERAERGVAIEAQGVVAGSQRIELEIDESIQSLFCRAGDRAVHTTFEGEIEVAFAATAPGAAPVAGTLAGVTLDFRPSARPSDAGREAEGERFLEFLGIRAVEGGSGLLVREVAAGSRAQAAGVAAGDVVVRFAGVRVGTLGDVLAPPGRRQAEIGVRRRGAVDELSSEIAVQGFRPVPAADLLGAWLAVLAALLIAVGAGAPAPAPVARALQRVLTRLRARGAGGSAAPRMRDALARAAFAAVPSGVAGAVADCVVCAALLVMPFGQYLVAEKMDVAILLIAAATALAVGAAVAAGSAYRAACAALHVLWQHVPGAVAVTSVVLTTGSLCVREVERSQGGWPWDWLAFRNPACLLAALLLLDCARIEPMPSPERRLRAREPRAAAGPVRDAAGRRTPDAPTAARVRPGAGAESETRTGGWLPAVRRAHRLVVAGLTAALFLGGWSLPGIAAADQDSRPALEMAGALIYLAKVAGAAAAIGACRWAGRAATHRERTRTTAAFSLPLAIGAALATWAYSAWGPPGAVQLWVSASLVLLVVASAFGLGRVLFCGLTSSAADSHLSPFI